jgi:diguanylate cyclase (GGDEF)-like protein
MQLFASPELALRDDVSSYTDFDIEFLKERSEKALTIEEVSALEFDSTVANRFALGYREKPVWFKFTIYNDSAKVTKVILEMTETLHKTVDLFTLSHHPVQKEKNGLDIPVSERKIEKTNPSFMLSFNPYETKKVYIRITSTYGIFGSIQLKKMKQFLKDTQILNNMMIFYFASVMIIAFYNLFIFLFLKEKIYLYYVGYILFFALWVSLYKGFLFYYIDVKTYDLLQLSLPASFMLLILFSQAILETKNYFPLIHKILNGFIGIISLSIIVMLIDLHSGFNFMNLCIMFLLPFLLFTAIYASIKGHTIAKIYLLVLFISFVGMSLVSLLALGFMKYSIVISYAPVIGSFFEVILFSLLLAYRINLFREKTSEAQNKLLEQQRTENSRLFRTVSEKTLALKNANKELSKELEEKKELAKHLKHHASTDTLTGLMNRRSYFKACEKEIKSATRYKTKLSYLMIDIDKFKKINDTYGHPFGDEVIRSLGALLIENSRSADYVARIGGEEFAILMPETDVDAAYHLADRLRANIAKHKIIYENKVVQITVSMGLSHLSEEDNDIESIVKRSDNALYEAKESGRNQVRCA